MNECNYDENHESVKIKQQKKGKSPKCLLRCWCSQQTSGATKDLSQVQNVVERGPLATVGGPIDNTQKTNLRNMVNANVDDYTKTPNQRKILRKPKKRQPTEN